MSIRVTSRVWEHSRQQGSRLLAILAIADHADDDGIAWPGIPRVAQKARVDERQAQRIVHKLAGAGELFVRYGRGRTNTNLYFVVIGLEPQAIHDTLVNRFEMTPIEAAVSTQELIKLQGQASQPKIKGGVDVTFSTVKGGAATTFSLPQTKEKGGTQTTFSEGKGDIFDGKGDTAMSPESMNHHGDSDSSFTDSSLNPLSGLPPATDNHQRQVDLASRGGEPIPDDPVEAVIEHHYRGFMGGPAPLPPGKRERKKWRAAGERILKSLAADWSLHNILYGIDDWWASSDLDPFWKDKPCKDETLDLVIRHCAGVARRRAEREALPESHVPAPVPPNEAEALWSKCLDMLRSQGRAAGLEGSRGLARENGSLHVACSRLQKEWAEQRLPAVMDGIMDQVAPGVKIVYEVTG